MTDHIRQLISTFTVGLVILAVLVGAPSWASPLSQSEPPSLTLGNDPDKQAEDPLNDPRLRSILMANPVAPTDIGGPDKFGYTWTNQETFDWIEPTDGIPVTFTNPDNGVSIGAIPIGFPFKFYEYTYTSLYVNVDGYVTFGRMSSSVPRSSIPYPAEPNAMIAAFGDDLIVDGSTGHVFYKTVGSEPNRKFVVIWDYVSIYGSDSEHLTFEIVLEEASGDIIFQYNLLNADTQYATIGIEDSDGLDGLLYLQYDSSIGLAIGRDVRFMRPSPAPRVKLLSDYRSAFTIEGNTSIPLLIRNTGEPASHNPGYTDRYNLVAAQEAPSGAQGWSASFYKADGITPLIDTDADGMVDTGPLVQGETFTMTVVVEDTTRKDPGSYVLYNLFVKSKNGEAANVQAVCAVQAAVPAPFAQAVVDHDSTVGGTAVDLVWNHRRQTTVAHNWFSGSNLSLATLANGGFIYLWERSLGREVVGIPYPVPYTDIEYSLLSRNGSLERTRVKLTNNLVLENPAWIVNDNQPAAATLKDGRTFAVWVRHMDRSLPVEKNSNVYMAIVGQDGNLAAGEINITGYTDWWTYENQRILQVPSIANLSETHVFVTWADTKRIAGKATSDIYYAVYDIHGVRTIAPVKLTGSTVDGYRYHSPVVTALTGGRVLLAYSIEKPDGSLTIAYRVLNSSGGVLLGETEIQDFQGFFPDAVQLSTGQIVLVWPEAQSDGVAYVILDGTSYSRTFGPASLKNPDGRIAGYPSVTFDQDGHAIITWGSELLRHYLYYALINGAGSVITPPMIFYPVDLNSPLVFTSEVAQGNAPYQGVFMNFLPVLSR